MLWVSRMILLIWAELRDLSSVWSQSAVSWQVHDELSLLDWPQLLSVFHPLAG